MFTDPKKNVHEFGFIPGQRVVDFGSGSGHYVSELSTLLGPSGKVVAVDIEDDLLVKLKNEAIIAGRDNVEVIDGDVEKRNGTKLRDNFADGVVMSNILYQLRDVKGALEEAKRILKPGGRVCVIDWIDFSMVSKANKVNNLKPLSELDARKAFESAGFTLDRTFGAGESHYGLIFGKPLQ